MATRNTVTSVRPMISRPWFFVEWIKSISKLNFILQKNIG